MSGHCERRQVSAPRALGPAAAGILAVTVGLGGLAAQTPADRDPAVPAAAADPAARPDLVRQPYSAADVEFIAGMIPHHAQAVLIAGWAASHGARPDIRLLAERILVSQRDEIAWMRDWLRDRGERVPAADATHHRMKMGAMEHDMLMPGMLTDAQLAELDQARGPAWDRLFLVRMIAHHEGALKMASDLLKTHGAVQGDDMYKFVSDLQADQDMEIERMTQMLEGGSRE
jgi:uncharacterized protein (DUF305 family)